jgi:hypothetical protein
VAVNRIHCCTPVGMSIYPSQVTLHDQAGAALYRRPGLDQRAVDREVAADRIAAITLRDTSFVGRRSRIFIKTVVTLTGSSIPKQKNQ